MKAQVTENAAGLHFEIKDDGSAEYKKAAQLTREANKREDRGCEAMGGSRPVAWAVFEADGHCVGTYATQEHAKIVMEELAFDGMVYEPLYRQPSLANDERERFRAALADAINRPMGVIPASAGGLVSLQELEAARFRIRK
jgi:hypothetical protein